MKTELEESELACLIKLIEIVKNKTMTLKLKAALYTFLFVSLFAGGLILISCGYAKAIMTFLIFVFFCFSVYMIYNIIYNQLKYNYESKNK
jgi:hypothetical protein